MSWTSLGRNGTPAAASATARARNSSVEPGNATAPTLANAAMTATVAIPEAIAPQLRQVLYGLLLVFFTRYRRQGLIGEYRDVLK